MSSDHKLDQEILEAIFVIGFNTGMRRSDISRLKWEHVDFQKKAISKVMEKTQFSVFIPMTNGLYVFLKNKYENKNSLCEYVTPSLATMYNTFCYLHGVQGTPIVTLQSMVGHMDKRMTEAYMMHQTEELKRNAIDRYSMTSLLPEKKESLSKISIQDNIEPDQSQERGGFKI
ncbi:MAG: tyrosine-type recombinase/integrase [Lentisphaeraceae bacterium]|nr:tyrosine-type recombinase/integrase [Lentisphaeraceae bacterium]